MTYYFVLLTKLSFLRTISCHAIYDDPQVSKHSKMHNVHNDKIKCILAILMIINETKTTKYYDQRMTKTKPSSVANARFNDRETK